MGTFAGAKVYINYETCKKFTRLIILFKIFYILNLNLNLNTAGELELHQGINSLSC